MPGPPSPAGPTVTPMQRRTLEWLETLAKALFGAALAVLVLSLLAAAGIAGSDTALPLLEDVQREGRTLAALGALGGGIAAAGVLSGLGGILALLVADRLERTEAGDAAAVGPAPDPSSGAASPVER